MLIFQESLEEEKRKSKMFETVLIDQLCRFLSMHTVSSTNCTAWILNVIKFTFFACKKQLYL